ncbi:hypothetical protein B9N43_00485 [Denitratisoma sp. DHT3]|nr:hypothetical protein [Denitratisoma sp. DHT3]QDX79873.1 hypothetical protein B9N43_00485 [Denitratisoma sp. DHT3]
MPRHTGPRLGIVRALGSGLTGLTRKSPGNRAHPPGRHGVLKRASRKSEYGQQLIEKQKFSARPPADRRVLRYTHLITKGYFHVELS